MEQTLITHKYTDMNILYIKKQKKKICSNLFRIFPLQISNFKYRQKKLEKKYSKKEETKMIINILLIK